MKANIYFMLVFISVIGNTQEEIAITEYFDLKPGINHFNIERYYERRIIFYQRIGDNNFALYNTGSGIEEISELSMNELKAIDDYDHIWDPYTKVIYIDMESPKYKNGWYQLIISKQNTIEYLLVTENNSSQVLPSVELENGLKLFTEFSTVGSAHKTKFIIKNNEKVIWDTIEWGFSECHLYWLKNGWILKIKSPSIAGSTWGNYNTIQNIFTNEETSFSPEVIIGYGDGVILTSNHVGNSFIGITAWSTSKEVLYQDSSFPLTQMVFDAYPSEYTTPIIYFCYYDYPFIYCNIARVVGFSQPFCSLIMNLQTGKTILSPIGYHFLGAFPDQDE